MNLTLRNKAAFGFGAFGKDIVYMLVSGYLMYYYNVVLGMSSVFIGSVLMGARIFDALNDPIMGIIVAKTKTRWGRFRPWILTGTVLNSVTIYALFAVPVSMGDSGMRVYLAVIYVLWGVTYTLMDIPFWSMIPAITKPGKDREKLSSLARSCSGIGDAVPMVLTMAVVPIISGSTVLADYRIGFRWWALLIAVVFVISEVVFVFNVPEKQIEEVKTVRIGQMIKALFLNGQAMTVVVSVILVYTAYNILSNMLLYFFQFDIGDTDLYNIFVGIGFLAQIIGMMLVPAMRRKIEKRKLYILGLIIQAIGFSILLFMAVTDLYHAAGFGILCIPGVLMTFGFGILNVMLTVFLSDTVDYGEAKNGHREESVIFSMQTFTVKLASGIAIFLVGLAIDAIHLDLNAEVQALSTLTGMRLFMTVPSLIFIIAALIVFIRFYRLDDRKMEEVSHVIATARTEPEFSKTGGAIPVDNPSSDGQSTEDGKNFGASDRGNAP